MDDIELKTIEDLRLFIAGTRKSQFRMLRQEERYGWISKTLQRFEYLGLSKQDKGVALAYLKKCTGYSRQQLSRLIARYSYHGTIQREVPHRHCFATRYTPQDIALLAQTDNLHGRLSGPATKKILQREYTLYGKKAYQTLSQISVSHIYNLRQRKRYRNQACTFTKTRSVCRPIGERAIPRPEGKPGFIRIDSVHQGHQNGQPGVYSINTVDEVTQYQIVACVERINETCILSALEPIIEQYPFRLLEFHSDNGSEYINHQVAEMFQRIFIRLTKSRPRHPNDNALVESKNGSIIRKHLGYAPIPSYHATTLNTFFQKWLNPYLNFHRPCFFPLTVIDARGKQKKTYPYQSMMTPFDKFSQLPKAQSYLKKGVALAQLKTFALEMSDNEFAHKMNRAKDQFFRLVDLTGEANLNAGYLPPWTTPKTGCPQSPQDDQ